MLHSVLVDGVEAFVQLEDKWNDLARSVVTCHYTQTFEWAKLGWETRDASAGDRLICATVWLDARLVAVWPFQRNRLGPATRLEPLGCGIHEEYGDPLMAPDMNSDEICRELLALLRPMADIIEVPFVEQYGAARQVLERTGIFNIPNPLDSYMIERRGVENFDDLLQAYSSKFRTNLKQGRKRLLKLGELRFELPEDYASSVETIDWVIEEKRRWLRRMGKSCPWLGKGEARAFFLAASMKRGELGRVGLFRLTLNGKPIAAFLTMIDRARVELLATSFDPDYARYSPGMLIIEDAVRWCFEHGLDFDMRILRMDYKERWSNAQTVRIQYRAPLTVKGALVLLPDYLSYSFFRTLRAIFNAEQRASIRRVMKWRPWASGRSQSTDAQIEPSV
ncbi:GNAT family N-acetyltransferase [Rhizobium sp.]|uniref:GNAT family N-acetyltransferase n=1 Tax=Rhizobium sp. TaxID=391 RepID=UPI0028A85AAD